MKIVMSDTEEEVSISFLVCEEKTTPSLETDTALVVPVEKVQETAQAPAEPSPPECLSPELDPKPSQDTTKPHIHEEQLLSETIHDQLPLKPVEDQATVPEELSQENGSVTDEMEVMRRPSYQDQNAGQPLKSESYSPPTFSRAPPDGDEFPPKYCELLGPPPALPEKHAMPAESPETRTPSVGRSYSLSSPPEYLPYNKSSESNGCHTNEAVARLNQRNSAASSKYSNRWNSEESLTKSIKTNGRIFNRRESEKAPSVRDRIALFNKPETATANMQNGLASKQELPSLDLQKVPILTNGKESVVNGYAVQSVTEHKVPSTPVKSVHVKSASLSEPNCKELPIRRESIPGFTSSYPQTQLTNHLRHSYAGQKSFEDYKRTVSNGGGYQSVLDSRRGSAATKLKGLIIPEKPPPVSASSKALPTILSSTANSSPPRSSFSSTNNLWNWSEQRHMTNEAPKTNGSILLSEPPWKAMASYETPQVFKSRSIELTKASTALTCSVSPTPPSSVTSPLSPPPSSPSSVCSSSTSSSCGISKQSTFQFSLSHSKPVTPTLPEKPILVSPTPSSTGIQNQDEPSSLYTTEKCIFMPTTKGAAPPLPKSAPPPPLPASEPPVQKLPENSTKPVVKQIIEKTSQNETSEVIKLSALERLDSLVSFSYPVKLNSEISTDLVSPQRTTNGDSRLNGKGLSPSNTSSYTEQKLQQHQAVTREDVSLMMNENGRISSNSSVFSNNTSDSRVWSSRPASESDDDTNSVISLRTEDSRQTADDSLSDATTDSLDRNNHDPEFKPRKISQQRTVLRAHVDSTDSVKNFRALAERWELRAGETPEPVSRTNSNGIGGCSLTRKDSGRSTSSSVNEGSVKLPPSLMPRCSNDQLEKDKGSFHSLPTSKTSRSSSISTTGKYKYNDSTDPLLMERSKRLSSMERSVSSFALDMVGGGHHNESTTRNRSSTLGPMSKSTRSVSVSDIRKSFEGQKNADGQNCKSPLETGTSPIFKDQRKDSLKSEQSKDRRSVTNTLICPTTEIHHRRFSSMDSTASDSGVSTPAHYGSTSSLAAPSTGSRDLFGSVTSLASTSSLISAQELQQLIDEANHSLSEEMSGLSNGLGLAGHEVSVVVLHKDNLSGSVGITLAGGADYEVKEITVHKVINGSLSDRDGRLRKGDRIISINGRNLKGVTHREALEILKSPRQEVVLVTSREKSNSDCIKHVPITTKERAMSLPANHQPRVIGTTPAVEKACEPTTASTLTDVSTMSNKSGQVVTLELIKDGSGLGFSLEGGKDSPQGDKPLTVKRVFKGGAADREGNLTAGDEIISVNRQAVSSMTRTEVWNYMKKLSDGQVTIVVKKV